MGAVWNDTGLNSHVSGVRFSLPPPPALNQKNMTDDELHELFVYYGKEYKKSVNKFLEGLKEIYRRGLYQELGYKTIFEYAKDLADLEEEIVREALGL